MKDVLCPVCNTRGVPFWKAYWMFLKVRCEACDSRLTVPIWHDALVFMVLSIPVIVVGVFLIAVPYVGWLLMIPYFLAIRWIQVRVIKLAPIKHRK